MKKSIGSIACLIAAFTSVTSSPFAAEIKKKDSQIVTGEIKGIIVLEDDPGLTTDDLGGGRTRLRRKGYAHYYKIQGKDVETIDERGLRCKRKSDVVMIKIDAVSFDLLDELGREQVENHKLLASRAKLLGEFRMEDGKYTLIPAIEIITEKGDVAAPIDEIVDFVTPSTKPRHWLFLGMVLLGVYIITVYKHAKPITSWGISFRGVPIQKSYKTDYVVTSQVTTTTTMYDLSKAGHHTLKLNREEFVFHFKWFFQVPLWFIPGMVVSILIAGIFETGSVLYWLCVVAGGLFSLILGASYAASSIEESEMMNLVIKERGGKEENWYCVSDNEWETFLKSLSQRKGYTF